MKKFSVVITSYNSEKYIKETLESICNQTYKHFEVLIIDNYSSDGTVEIAESFQNKIDIKILYNNVKKNIGLSRNIGIKNSKYEYIAFIDSDDLWTSNKLQEYSNLLDTSDFICSNASIIDDKSKVIQDQFFYFTSPEVTFDSYDLLKTNYVITSTVVCKKKLIFEAGLFEQSKGFNGEDYILWLNISNISNIKFINLCMTRYRIHNSNLSFENLDSRNKLLFDTMKIKEDFIDKFNPGFRKFNNYFNNELNVELSYNYLKLKNYPKSFSFFLKSLRPFNFKSTSKFIIKYFLKFIKNFNFISEN